MNKDQKSVEIGKVRERFEKSVAAVLVDFQGLNVASATKLRRAFKKAGVEYKVVKNSLIRHALKDSPYKAIVGSLERDTLRTQHKSLIGMTGVAWCNESPSAAAKVIEEFKKTAGAQANKLNVKVGLKETQAAILATMMAPAQQTVTVLNAPAQNLVFALQAWVDKLKEQAV